MANGFVLIDCLIVPAPQRMPVTFCIENSAGLKQICLVGVKAPTPASGELDACKQSAGPFEKVSRDLRRGPGGLGVGAG